MDISDKLKSATAFAKDNNFDSAIEVLQEVLPNMAIQAGYPHSSYTKIIPYFQKAQRYSEVESYCESVLLPLVKQDCEKAFGHKPSETILAFYNLHVSMVYEKLALCSKREKNKEDEKRFKFEKDKHYIIYDEWFAKEHGANCEI